MEFLREELVATFKDFHLNPCSDSLQLLVWQFHLWYQLSFYHHLLQYEFLQLQYLCHLFQQYPQMYQFLWYRSLLHPLKYPSLWYQFLLHLLMYHLQLQSEQVSHLLYIPSFSGRFMGTIQGNYQVFYSISKRHIFQLYHIREQWILSIQPE